MLGRIIAVALQPGADVGPYRVTSQIGIGGMGEVYRATDTKLGRDVAIKVLPDNWAQDAERLARFDREARTLAALNHPNIAAIHGLETVNGVPALIMELVEGDTLAARLRASGASARQAGIPIDEALPIAKQMADALEAAHEHGIVHRDVKPANVKVRSDGVVKVLDFGLARMLDPTAASTNDPAASPTITSPAVTRAGIILGTAAYMSPEQAKGRPLDKRADIWAFGCVLYEMLTGARAFPGDDVSDALAAVIRGEPDWRALPEATPPSIRRLLRRCLEKDRKRRLADIGDARLEIEEALTASPVAEAGAVDIRARRRVWPERAAWLVVSLALAGSVAWLVWRPPDPNGLVRTTITVPPGLNLQGGGGDRIVAMSPDGRRIAFVGAAEGNTQIYMRSVDEFDPVPVAGTEGGVDPFFSPDGQWLGFMSGAVANGGVVNVSEGAIKKVAITGGPATPVSDVGTNRGASWGPDGTIVFAVNATSPLWRVSATGGKPEQLTKLEPSERSHRWPSFLPGGKAFLFSIQPTGATFDDGLMVVRSLDTGEQRVIARGGASPVYVPTGHIVFARAGVLMAMPFDLRRLEATGPAVPVLEGVMMNAATGATQFATAAGALVYAPGSVGTSRRELLWVDRKGAARPIDVDKRPYTDLSISPDGQNVALAIASVTSDIWVYSIARGTLRRLTFSPGLDSGPIWTTDGRAVTFTGIRSGPLEILQTSLDDSGSERRLIDTGAINAQARSWHPTGKWLALEVGGDIQVLSLSDPKPQSFTATSYTEGSPVFSPDGAWIMYQSNESGRYEIYVQRFPGPGGKMQVSVDGGVRPRWSRDGRELFFRSGNRMMSVPIEHQPVFSPGSPRVLFEGEFAIPFDVAADGRFLMMRDDQPQGPPQFRFVTNWLDELSQRVPRD